MKTYIRLITSLALLGLYSCSKKPEPSEEEIEEQPLPPEATAAPIPSCAIQANPPEFVKKCCHFENAYFVGSFIYWQPRLQDFTTTAQQTAIVGSQTTATVKSPNFSYAPGFKLGIGYKFKPDGWDLFVNWTWIHARPKNSWHAKSAAFQTFVPPLSLPFPLPPLATDVSTRGKITFNSLDLELGKRFLVLKNVSLRPFGGLKTAWFKYRFNTTFDGVVSQTDASVLTNVVDTSKDRVWGIGPRAGLNSRWIFGRSNFAFVANAAASLLWERFRPKASATFTDDGVAGGVILKENIKEFKPSAELFVGFDWGACVSKEVFINLSAGYEVQYWWDQIMMPTVSPKAYDMHGLTTSLRLDF